MNQRQEEILTCVVDHFIDSHQPISSKMVLDMLTIQLSSATVRQVFSVLDHEGDLAKLHTSSGRIPTDKGYRVYVDKIKGNAGSIELDGHVTDQAYQMKFRYLFDQLLTNVAKKIPYISMISLNDHALSDIAMLKYVSISSHYGLVLLVHRVGIVSEHYVRFDMDVSSCDFDTLTHWVLLELQRKGKVADIQLSYKGEDAHYLERVASVILNHASIPAVSNDVMIKNVNQCLALADYEDKASVQQLLDVLDDSEVIHRLMSSGFRFKHLDVCIGQELNDPRLMQSSFISIPICLDGIHVACLGVLGPRRMDYLSIIRLLSSSETLAELIQV